MVKILKRTTDNKYLKSIETETWVDDIKDAYEMTYRECEEAKTSLNDIFFQEQLKEIVIMTKSKPITKEEKKELRNLLKTNNM
jgi:zona occludens toxin (predicted ATPase)